MKKLLAICLLFSGFLSFGQGVQIVNPSLDPNAANYADIKNVRYVRPENGQVIVQNSPASGVSNAGTFPIHIDRIEAWKPGTNRSQTLVLDYFNFEGVEIRNMHLNGDETSVGVYEDGTSYPASGNFAVFQQKLKEFLLNGNMRSMVYFDGNTGLPCADQLPPACTTQDFDIQFAYAFESTDYLLASERYGNSTFFVFYRKLVFYLRNLNESSGHTCC